MHAARKPGAIRANQLSALCGKKGPDSGATSCVYYGGYVFFEKLRIKEGKPKSKHRQDMEAIYGHKGGMDLETDGSKKG
jgi:hypothetical protein